MKHSRSAAEQEIRDDVVARCRSHLPRFRIVHEMVVRERTFRADVAAISKDRILLFEIKSERDTLKRFAAQMDCFREVGHAAIAVVHERFFEPKFRDELYETMRLDSPFTGHLWRWPQEPNVLPWRTPRPTMEQPAPRRLLELLWHAELRQECWHHRLATGQRATRADMMNVLAWNLTGREICLAVCRQLRGRDFAEADPPIVETREAAE